MLLDHALKIQAEENYTAVIAALTPNMSKTSRKQVIESYLRIVDGDRSISSDIIKRDRERLRKLLSKKLWLKEQK